MVEVSDQFLAEIMFDLKRLNEQMGCLKAQLAELQSGNNVASTEKWLPTNEAAAVLKAQGIRSGKELRDLIRIGVLPVDKKHVRNIGTGTGRPTYQFCPSACARVINAWKGLTPEDRQRRRQPAA